MATIRCWKGQPPYQARWHAVARCIRALLGVLPVLQQTWSEAAFLGSKKPRVLKPDEAANPKHMGKEFAAEVVTAAMKDGTFHAKCGVIAALDSGVEEFASWAGGCSCHGDVMQKYIDDGQLRRQTYSRLLRQHFRGQLCPCLADEPLNLLVAS